MEGIVDRIENNIVIVEIKEKYIDFDLHKFPKEIKEGDIVKCNGEKFEILVEKTKTREKKIKLLFESLLEEDK